MPRMRGTARPAVTAAGRCEPRWGERITAAATIITIIITGGGGGFGGGGGEGGGSSVLALASVQQRANSESSQGGHRCAVGEASGGLDTARYSYR